MEHSSTPPLHQQTVHVHMVSASSPTWTIKMKQRCWSNEWLLRTPPEWNYFSHFPSLDIFLLPGWSSVWLLLVFINFHSIQKSSEAGQENSRTGGRKEERLYPRLYLYLWAQSLHPVNDPSGQLEIFRNSGLDISVLTVKGSVLSVWRETLSLCLVTVSTDQTMMVKKLLFSLFDIHNETHLGQGVT